MANVTCRRPGCGKSFDPNSNADNACRHHTALPLFHDGVKQWPCCGQKAWDWESFMKLGGCAVGPHSNEPPQQHTAPPPAAAAPQQSTAAAPAPAPAPSSIEEFNRKQQQQREERQLEQKVSAKGERKCSNKGCNKQYREEENNNEACSYHPGEPTFRDGCKSWTCCGGRAYEWEEFVALPTCKQGPHVPKMVPAQQE